MGERILLWGMLVFAVIAAFVFWNQWRTWKTMDTIEQMLKAAMDGTFVEERFDESKMSALQTRFAHYLSASELSARNVAEEKDKMKTLIADISHQTKTPIANLMLYSELLREEELSESARINVEAIYVQTEKLHFLIDSLVKLSRLENKIISLTPKRRKVLPMLQTVAEQYRIKAEDKGLTLHLEERDVSAEFDTKWTAEALGNIIDNAIKYTQSGEVNISVCEYEMFVRIDVADSGIGISENEYAKVFSRFYRGEAAKEQEGVGIGLYLAREIISGQGGYIKVCSVPGEGATFSVFLPR